MENEEFEYLNTFHSIILDGILFGLKHPGEMWINKLRILEEWGDPTKHVKHARRFFNEMYEVYNAPIVEKVDPENVKEWIRSIYPKDHIFRNDFIESMLWAYDYKEKEK